MTDINKVFLIGRLTRDAELKQLTNTTVCNFSLALNRSVKDSNTGNWNDEAHFFDVELYGRQGEAVHKYLQKGKQVGIEGSLRQNRWEDSGGQKRSRVVVVATSLQLLSGGGAGGDFQSGGQSASEGGSPAGNAPGGSGYSSSGGYDNAGPGDIDDDIPF